MGSSICLLIHSAFVHSFVCHSESLKLLWEVLYGHNKHTYRPVMSYIKGATRVVNLVTTLAVRVSAQSRAVSN